MTLKDNSVKELDFEQLYRMYFVKVCSYVMGIVKDPSAAEEITQNTFVKAITVKNTYKGLVKEFTWLCSIAKNLSYDYFRKRKKIVEIEEEKHSSLEEHSGYGLVQE